MTAFAPLGFIGSVRRHLIAALDAWSYGLAKARAERRRQRAAAKTAPVTGPAQTPRWPTSWGD